MKLSQVEWLVVGKAAAKEYGNDDIPGLASEMAYKAIFALFPFVIFLAALAGIIGRAIGQGDLFANIMSYLYQAVPTAADAIRKPLEDVLLSNQGGALSIGALLALFGASAAIETTMKAFNRAYGVKETRNFVVLKLYAIALTIVLSLLLIFGFVLLVAGGAIEGWLTSKLALGGVFSITWTILRFIMPLVGVSLALALLYWKGPNVQQQFQWLTPGALATTIFWFLMTLAFGLYVKFLGQSSYSKTYGALWGIILFMMYLYLTSTVILLGAELNAETTKRYDPETIRDKITDPRKQLPGKQPQPDPQALREAGVSRGDVATSNRPEGSAGGLNRTGSADGATADESGGEFSDPRVRERVAALRAADPPSAARQARLAQASIGVVEREQRARQGLMAAGVAVIAALGGLLSGALRRRMN